MTQKVHGDHPWGELTHAGYVAEGRRVRARTSLQGNEPSRCDGGANPLQVDPQELPGLRRASAVHAARHLAEVRRPRQLHRDRPAQTASAVILSTPAHACRAAARLAMALAPASDQPGCRYSHRDRIPHRGGTDGVSGRHSYRRWHHPLVEAGSSRLSRTRPPERIGTTVASTALAPPSRIWWTRPPCTCHGSTTGRCCPCRSEGMGSCWTAGHSARKRVARRDDLRRVTPAGDFTTRLN